MLSAFVEVTSHASSEKKKNHFIHVGAPASAHSYSKGVHGTSLQAES